MKHKRLMVVALVAAVGASAVGSAVATPGSGIVGAPVLARGTLDGHFKIKLRDSSKPGDVAIHSFARACWH